MTTQQAFKKIVEAKTAAALFGDDKNAMFKRLAKLVHPDMVDGKMKARAHEAFTKLNRLYAEANGKAEPFSIMKIGSWIVKGSLAKGEIADLYGAVSEKDDEAVFKIARAAKDNDLMEAEAESLKKLWKSATTDNFKKYLPQMFESFKASGRRVNVLMSAGKYHRSLVDILSQYPGGLDFRHIVWMMNRLLSVLGYIHEQGIVHGAILPEHLLYQTEDHGLMLVDWCYSVEQGKPIRAIVKAHKSYYPPEVLKKRGASPATDIYMAAKVMLLAAERVPIRFRALLEEWCLVESVRARPQDAWGLQERWETLAKEEYGSPKYVRLEMVVH